MNLQKELKIILKGSFEFRNTKPEKRIVSRETAGYSAIRHYLDQKHLSYYTLSPNRKNP
jgi:hypothetical protein